MSRFVRLCEISSPTGEEAAVAAFVRAELEGFGFMVEEDNVADTAGAGCGNLLCRIPGDVDSWITFCAHLDTVPHEGRIEVVLDGDIYRSAGETILGADNKAAVAVLIELAARHRDQPPAVGLELLFTVAEEQGLRGAFAFDSSKLKSSMVFVLDHATDIGEVIVAAPSHHGIEARFEGVEAHSGLDPESGRSAIAAAAAAIAEMKLGRLDPETTANIGQIEGGTSSNVVPGGCRVSGEARSVDPDRAVETIMAISDSMIWAASEHGCEVDIRTEKVFDGYRIDDDSVALKVAEAGLKARGHQPLRVATGGGSDANVFNAFGLDAILLANGTYANHTHQEWVPRENLIEMLEVCETMIEEAASC
ncbi:MAG: M20/M25/M40 family metallo-hydrolase [Solirubrobacterales bacterium]